jgi:hypothetical protein
MQELAGPGDRRIVVGTNPGNSCASGAEAVKSFDADLRLSRSQGDTGSQPCSRNGVT